MANLTALKTADKDYIFVGCDDTLRYMIQINNIGETPAIDVILEDVIPDGLEFIPNSVSINGVKQSYISMDDGISIGTIDPGATVIVTFDVNIHNNLNLNEISNLGVINFKDGVNPEETGTAITNELTIPVIKINLQVWKSVNKEYVLVNDILTFNIEIINNSNIVLNNILFKDVLQTELEFVDRSVKLNGVQYDSFNPNIGFSLENMNPKSTSIVTFQAIVKEVPCNPIIKNAAVIEFEYNLPQEPFSSSNGCVTSNTVSINIGPNSFKQLSVDEIVKIPSYKPDAEEILDVNIEVEIVDLNLIKTICGVSYEGKRLTGNKLIVNGLLKQIIEYVALNPEQSVHAAEFDVPFSTFIIVPQNFILNESTNINTYIEDIYFQLLDKRTIFKNITLFLEVGC